MALTTGNPILASELISIKARVKAEMLRRNQVGSLTAYGDSSYDYTVIPTAGGKILPEHWNKLITPMNAMVNTGMTTVSSGQKIPSLKALNDLLTQAEGYNITGNTTNCKSSCSGLCVGTCKTVCCDSVIFRSTPPVRPIVTVLEAVQTLALMLAQDALGTVRAVALVAVKTIVLLVAHGLVIVTVLVVAKRLAV